jgi:thioredoxin-like negative regulator of GroEL
MTGLMLWIAIMAGATADQPLNYDDAYESATKSKKPMLILVSADWCPACRVMKQTTLPQLFREGKLVGVCYTIVDIDQMPRLSSQLMRSSTIPQLILWTPVSDGWQRTYLQGGQAPDRIVEMVRNGLDEQRRDFATNDKNRTTTVATADE